MFCLSTDSFYLFEIGSQTATCLILNLFWFFWSSDVLNCIFYILFQIIQSNVFFFFLYIYYISSIIVYFDGVSFSFLSAFVRPQPETDLLARIPNLPSYKIRITDHTNVESSRTVGPIERNSASLDESNSSPYFVLRLNV